MSPTIISLPGEVLKAEAKRNGVIRLLVESQEEIPEDLRSRTVGTVGKPGWFNFLPEMRPIAPEDVLDLPKLELRPEDVKSPAQRLRGVLYRLWEQARREGYAHEFELYYAAKMERIIGQVKESLD